MLKNYIKIALKVLLRRKFFTFVSLSGITFTLAVLIIAAAFVDHMMSPARPGSKFDRSMFIERIELRGEDMHIYSHPGYVFLDRYVRTMETPEAVSVHTVGSTASVYVQDQRLDLQLKHTDAVFWDILEFEFLEGRAFDQQAVDNADYVAVISERTRRQVFGNEPAVGKFLETTEGNYRIVGVVPKEDMPTMLAAADIFAPLTTSQESMNSQNLYGGHLGFVLASDRGRFEEIKAEFAKKLDQVHKDYAGEYTMINCRIETQAEAIISYIFGSGTDATLMAAIGFLIGSMLLFMLFPAINLVSLNVTRIMERASEIGIRKAFGASSLTLVGQFLTENIILTLIGGALAWIVSWVVLWMITNSDITPYGEFQPSLVFLGYCLIMCLTFGIVSGVYPAYRMSRMQPVEALRGVEQ
jgi:putative ABC transport system permease protein